MKITKTQLKGVIKEVIEESHLIQEEQLSDEALADKVIKWYVATAEDTGQWEKITENINDSDEVISEDEVREVMLEWFGDDEFDTYFSKVLTELETKEPESWALLNEALVRLYSDGYDWTAKDEVIDGIQEMFFNADALEEDKIEKAIGEYYTDGDITANLKDIYADIADGEEYARDPLGYYGMHQSDFM